MREPIENEYFNWLCAKVLDRSNRNYRDLLEILHRTEFVWIVHMDQNRAEDGIELRQDFLRESRAQPTEEWMEQPCSIFEMFLAFAKRASFQTDTPVEEWFWAFITNLKLDQYRHVSNSDVPIIEDILYTFIWRTYDPSGHGGIFPMNNTRNDQRQIEIFYQFCEYLEDQGLLL